MSFLGYYVTDVTLRDDSLFPTSAAENDTVIGIYQEPDNQFRLAQAFTYVSDAWVVTGDATAIESTNPPLLPLEERALNISEAYGMGWLSMNYAYVDVHALPTWIDEPRVGNDTVDETDLELHNVFSGQPVEGAPSTTGLLPIYVRDGNTVVGVGSAVFTGAWHVLWYKVSIGAGMLPTVGSDIGTVLSQNGFKMIGNTSGYTMNVYDAEGVQQVVEGVYSGTYTTYDFSSFNGTWQKFVLVSPQNYDAYIATNLYKPIIDDVIEDLAAYKEEVEEEINDVYAELEDRIPTNIASKIAVSIAASSTVNTVFINVRYVNPVTGQLSFAAEPMAVASETAAGVMSAEMKATFDQAIADITSLKNTGGVWIGQNFATHAALAAYIIPATVRASDFTYVLADETHDDVRTIYVAVKDPLTEAIRFEYSREDGTETIGIATAVKLGLVLSSVEAGQVYVESGTGKMSLNGYDDIVSNVSDLQTAVGNLATDVASKVEFTAPASGPLANKTLTQIVEFINQAFQGQQQVAINHSL